MKKILSKWYILLIPVCIIGFFVGYFADKHISNVVDADVNENSISPLNWNAEKLDCSNIFDEQLYNAMYNKGDKTIYISVKKNVTMNTYSKNDMYMKDDAKKLAELMLGDSYELRLISDDGVACMYEEYKDGHQTGGLATYMFDNEGYLTEASFRAGRIYEFDENDMISEVEAYELSIKAIKGKYGEDTEIIGTFDDCQVTTYYVPYREEICYEIKIRGHVQEYVGTLADPVSFWVTVSPDGSFIQVASSLRK